MVAETVNKGTDHLLVDGILIGTKRVHDAGITVQLLRTTVESSGGVPGRSPY